MTIEINRYKLLADFHRVLKFLEENYETDTFNSYLLPQFFEYAHTHPFFNHKETHRMGLWEKQKNIVGLVCYEMEIGESFLVSKKGYEHLWVEMLSYAEKELVKTKDGKNILDVWVINNESAKIKLLKQNDYQKIHSEPVTIYPYEKGFNIKKLPTGFSLLSLEDENNITKIHNCLWQGFDHGSNPDDDLDCRLLMQSGPNFDKSLTTIIKAPNGDYACYAGMWYSEINKYAYLEPLATVPKYRGLGLARIALTEGMKKTKRLGAKYCFGGVIDFYEKIGFEKVASRELWRRRWPADL